ncbi:MAG: hypothetical protein KGJ86_20245, partial [Chloroflexota bacterium]|nr:hypothetical protein [Chloroflexota bacterium]
GDSVQVSPRDQVGGPAFLKHSAWAYGREERSYPVASDLATDLIRGLVERDFDVSTSKSLPGGRGIGHAFAFIYERVLNGKRVPMIPIMFNDFFAPNQPTPGRAYDFGTAIREIVREWPSDKNVCVIASGGLSHFVIDVELDEWILKALQNKDVAGLRSLQRSALQSGTSEALNWIATAAAADELSMKPIDFIPCYRTPAGTGCAMGFARWD